MEKNILAIILSLIAVILIVISIFIPWWLVDPDDIIRAEDEYKLREKNSDKYSNEEYKDKDFVERFNVTFIFVILALIFSILFSIIIFIKRSGLNKSRNIIYLIGAITILYSLLAPFFLMITLPGAIHFEDGKEPDFFWGSTDVKINNQQGTVQKEYWAGMGWYLIVIAMVLNIVALISVQKYIKLEEKKMRRRKMRPPKHQCPNCSEPLTYIDEYESWYCYDCEEYID